jgi:peroxiredoxin
MKRGIIIFLACVLAVVAFVYVRSFYISYSLKRNIISEAITVPLKIRSDATDVDIMSLKGKYIVLYFWNSADKNCLKGLEKFREMYNSRLKNDDRVQLYAVHSHSGNDSYSAGVDYLQANSFTFPTFSLSSQDKILNELKIKSFPTTVIISPEWKIVFRGSTKSAFSSILAYTYALK